MRALWLLALLLLLVGFVLIDQATRYPKVLLEWLWLGNLLSVVAACGLTSILLSLARGREVDPNKGPKGTELRLNRHVRRLIRSSAVVRQVHDAVGSQRQALVRLTYVLHTCWARQEPKPIGGKSWLRLVGPRADGDHLWALYPEAKVGSDWLSQQDFRECLAYLDDIRRLADKTAPQAECEWSAERNV